jgi:uncharacterized protein YjdB
MATFKVAYNQATHKAIILDGADALPTGSVDAGTFEHIEGGVGAKPTHALFHHVQDLLQKLGVVDMASVQIEYQADHIAVRGVIVNFTACTLAVGDTKQITPTMIPQNSSEQGCIYSSQDESKVTVSSTGLIAAQAATQTGSVEITIKTKDGGHTAKVQVVVE